MNRDAAFDSQVQLKKWQNLIFFCDISLHWSNFFLFALILVHWNIFMLLQNLYFEWKYKLCRVIKFVFLIKIRTNNFAMFKAPLLQTSMFFSTETMTRHIRGVIFGIYSSKPKRSKKSKELDQWRLLWLAFAHFSSEIEIQWLFNILPGLKWII